MSHVSRLIQTLFVLFRVVFVDRVLRWGKKKIHELTRNNTKKFLDSRLEI